MPNLRKRKIKTKPLSTASLYRVARLSGIPVYPYPLQTAAGLSLMNEQGECVIGLSPKLTAPHERLALAHELGHCLRGAFYNESTSPLGRGKCEYKADKWAIENLLPRDALEQAIRHGAETPDELAEYFELPENFIRKALEHYVSVESMK